MVGITYGIRPYGDHVMGWTSPRVLGLIGGGLVLLAVFCLDRDQGGPADVPPRAVPDPRLHAPATSRTCSPRSAAAACSSRSSSGCRESGCPCTATTSSTRNRCRRQLYANQQVWEPRAAGHLFVSVTFAPKAAGSAQGFLTIHDSASSTPVTVALAGLAIRGIDKIQHIVYLVKENRSFDSYFGTFPGANGATTGVISTGR